MCAKRQYGSTDIQHDVLGSGHDLDLWSNFQHDSLRQIILDSTHLDKTITMLPKLLPYLY